MGLRVIAAPFVFYMATFCYTTRDGETVEDFYPCGQAPKKIKLPDGRSACRDYVAEIAGKGSQLPGCWPLKSTSMGVLPSQVKQAAEKDISLGVPTDYCEKTGRVIFSDPNHQYRWMKAHGAHNYDGGYRSN